MLNDRDDKYENHEESEYHFSDEEVNYEVEPETPKLTAQSKESFINRLGRSKRMIISVVVFLVLVFVVYKMVAPTSTTTIPNTDIAPTSPQASITSNNVPVAAPTMQPDTQPATAMQVSNTASPENLSAASTNNAAAVNTNIPTNMPVAPPVSQQPMMSQQSMMPPEGQAVPNTMSNAQSPVIVVPETTPGPAPYSQAQMMPSQIPQQVAQPAASAMPSAVPQMMSAPAAPAMENAMPQTAPQNVAAQPSPGVALPSVMPVQSASTYPNQAVMPQQAPMVNMPNVANRLSAMSADSERLTNQLQADYAQKLTDYAAQNKALQDQVQTLNARVAGMETQMGQLIQVLTRQMQSQQNGGMMPPSAPQAQPQAAPAQDVKVGFNVQAIIPGRAWLRSDNGETVTVAEGDMIRDLGRVTKIDPYDGVVEINTGTRMISLAYGNNA